MTKKVLVTLLTIVLVCAAFAPVLNPAFCSQLSKDTGNFTSSYKIAIQNGYHLTERDLYVSFPLSLIDYYEAKSHTLNDEMDFVKFVTPSAVQSIAEKLRGITQEMPYCDEEFANTVLTFVRQIPYVKSNAKYPVETLFSNKADCDGLSVLAASVMKAGGLDVVLLFYSGINPTHMNIGVCLEQMPVTRSWWASPTGFEHDNKTYWVAECTSLSDWTVGDRPELLSSIEPTVIPLTNCREDFPVQVSSSLDNPMNSSAISINLAEIYSETNDGTRIVNVSGSISPPLPNQLVVLYINQPGYAPTAYIAFTDAYGKYAEIWNATLPGTYVLKASWCGSLNYSGSDSDAITVLIGAEKPVVVAYSGESSESQISEIQFQQNFPLNIAMLNRVSKEFLKSNLTGTDIVLSGDFMVLSDGHEVDLNKTTITIPSHPRTYRLPRSRQLVTIMVPERVISIPGAERLSSHFCFILTRNIQDNYTASVRTLNGDDLSEITQNLTEKRAVVINASKVAAKQSWYKAKAIVSKDYVSVEVCHNNGTLLDKVSQTKTSKNASVLGVLMMYQTGQIVAFKNLNVETIPHDTLILSQETALEATEDNSIDFLYPPVRASLLSAGAFLAIVSLWQRRKRSRPS